MTIEQKLLKDHGETDIPEYAIWLLKDGTLVNGSYEGYKRDIDHNEISEYFHRSIREQPGSNYCYIIKFLNRGNIRIGCENICYYAQLRRIPTNAQLRTLARIMGKAQKYRIATCIEWKSQRNVKYSGDWRSYLQYLSRYTNLISHNRERIARDD